jgi:mycofactocin precursor
MDSPSAVTAPHNYDKIKTTKRKFAMSMQEKEPQDAIEQAGEINSQKPQHQVVPILEEITIEELAVDGICGIY